MSRGKIKYVKWLSNTSWKLQLFLVALHPNGWKKGKKQQSEHSITEILKKSWQGKMKTAIWLQAITNKIRTINISQVSVSSFDGVARNY